MTSMAIDWNSVTAKANATGASRKFLDLGDAYAGAVRWISVHASTLNPGASNHGYLTRRMMK